MRYAEAKQGRVFVLKFDHNDDFLECILQFAERENVMRGVVHFMGALKSAEIVCGPKRPVLPQKIYKNGFDDGREVLGMATIFPDGGKPKVHVHASFGKNKHTLMGCMRESAEVYVVVEAVVTELVGISACRKKDTETGLSLLNVE